MSILKRISQFFRRRAPVEDNPIHVDNVTTPREYIEAGQRLMERKTITPDQVLHDDPLMREIVAKCFNEQRIITGNVVDGKIEYDQ